MSNNPTQRLAIKTIVKTLVIALLLPAVNALAFTYQGELSELGQTYTGSADLEFSLYDAVTGGIGIGSIQLHTDIAISNGRFVVDLDQWANNIDGTPLWLRIRVAIPAGAALVGLSPRQKLGPTPYAEFAYDGVGAGGGIYLAGTGLTLNGDTFDVNVGTGNGLDADLLDGMDSNAFMASAADNWVDITGDTMTGVLTVDAEINTSSAYQINGINILQSPGNNLFLGPESGMNNTGTQNVFVGHQAGVANTVGLANTFIGFRAGFRNTTGGTNLFNGTFAGFDNTTGYGNTFLGYIAGKDNTTGLFNTFVGDGAGTSNTTGFQNSFIGRNAGNANTLGYGNTFVGYLAGQDNQVGVKNTFSGIKAGQSNTTGERNTFVGGYAGMSNTTGQFNTFVGEGAGVLNTTGFENTYIGKSAGVANTVGQENTFVGYESGLSNTVGIRNTFLGNKAGAANTSGQDNVFTGVGAGFSNTTGNFNTFSGLDAGFLNTMGGFNTFRGYQAGYSNTTAENGVYSGYQAGFSNTTGNANTFTGTLAGFTNTTGFSNVFLGRASGANNQTGSRNAYVGTAAGQYSTGSNNTFVGYKAGNSSSGSANVFLGLFAGGNETGSSLLYIDNTSTASPLIWGDFSNDYLNINGRLTVDTTDFVSLWVKTSGNTKLVSWNSGGTAIGGLFVPPADGLYVKGNTTIVGTLSKGAGSFKIDHPLEPEEKYLYHSFVESPDMMNVYNGNVILDSNGEAWVELPDWFEALNREFRYQLTPVGGPAPYLHVAERVSSNRFRLAGGEQGLEVSWQVTGIRQDPFAKANRIPVVEDKSPEERGRYLHPKAWGITDPTKIMAEVELNEGT